MKTIRKIKLLLIAMVLIAGMLLSFGGQHQSASAAPFSDAVQMAQELDLDAPEGAPLLLEGEEFFQFSRVAWNS